MSTPDPPPAAFALWRLRSYVTACCAVLGLALAAQLFVWGMVSFTDVRFRVVEEASADPESVVIANNRPANVLTATGAQPPPQMVVPEPVRIQSSWGKAFRDLTSMSLGAGTITLLVLLMLVGVSAVLMAASSLPGVEKVVSAWIWTTVVAVLALPLRDVLSLPWPVSGLRSYDQIVAAAQEGDTEIRTAVHLAGCAIGLLVLMVRFRSGIGRSLPQHPEALDPELEKEAGNVKVTTLYGGRSAAALTTLMAAGEKGSKVDPAAKAPAAAKKKDRQDADPRPDPTRMPSASQLSPGAPPRRII